MRLFIILALNTGQRSKAILGLKWFQVDFDNRLIHFHPPGKKVTNKRAATIPMNAMVLKTLREARRKAKAEFVMSRSGKPITGLNHGFRLLCGDVGLEGVTPHTLRHTAGTWMAQGGVDMFQISGILGHGHSKTTELYLKHHPDYLQDGVAALATGKLLANKTRKTGKKGAKPLKRNQAKSKG